MLDSPSDNDDLTPMQEYVIAGGVILLFGLLYWYLNHGWNSETALATAPAPTQQSVRLEPVKFSAAAEAPTAMVELAVDDSKTSVTAPPRQAVAPTVAATTTAAATVAAPAAALPTKAATEPAQVVPPAAPAVQRASSPESTPAPAVQTEKLAAAPQITTYTLPDGSSIDIGKSNFGIALRDAIANHQTDKSIVFEGIQFDSGSSKPNVASGQPLKVVIALLHANPSIKLLIRGHTDEVGAAKDNTELSLVRANEVGVALVQAGIDRKRLRIMGMGSSEPISIDNTDSARQRNRRIDALILK